MDNNELIKDIINRLFGIGYRMTMQDRYNTHFVHDNRNIKRIRLSYVYESIIAYDNDFVYGIYYDIDEFILKNGRINKITNIKNKHYGIFK